MRLATVERNAGTTAAAQTPRGYHAIVDARGASYADVGDLLRRERDWRGAAERAIREPPLAGATLRLRRPVLAPGAVVCVGLNYRRHILEMKRELPSVPTLFSKLPRALADPDAVIELPAASEMADYEGELAVVIGSGGRDLAADRAWDAVAGLTLLNDVTMRDFQRRSLQWFAGKSWERSTPLGPVVVTRDELPDLARRRLVTTVAGEVRQESEIGDMLFDVPTLVADLSRIVALEPGDVIATGTPAGVGDARTPPSYLRHGDEVVVSVEGIGELRNRFERRS